MRIEAVMFLRRPKAWGWPIDRRVVRWRRYAQGDATHREFGISFYVGYVRFGVIA